MTYKEIINLLILPRIPSWALWMYLPIVEVLVWVCLLTSFAIFVISIFILIKLHTIQKLEMQQTGYIILIISFIVCVISIVFLVLHDFILLNAKQQFIMHIEKVYGTDLSQFLTALKSKLLEGKQ